MRVQWTDLHFVEKEGTSKGERGESAHLVFTVGIIRKLPIKVRTIKIKVMPHSRHLKTPN